MATSKHPDHERAWDLMEKITFPMLTTWNGHELRSRPMAAYVNRDEGRIYFLFDVRQHKEDEVKAFPQVNLAFADAGDQKYVSVSGAAEALNDRAKIKELFGTPAKAWWQSAEDPNIRVLRVTPDQAQFWDTPGSVASYVKIVFAAMTGTRPDLGTNARVRLDH